MTTDEFIKQHGGPPVPFRGAQLLRDGATISHNGLGPVLRQPPDGRAERATLALRYRLIRLEQAEAALRELSRVPPIASGATYCIGSIRWRSDELGPPPSGADGNLDHAAAIKSLQSLVKTRRACVKIATAQLAAIAPHCV